MHDRVGTQGKDTSQIYEQREENNINGAKYLLTQRAGGGSTHYNRTRRRRSK